ALKSYSVVFLAQTDGFTETRKIEGDFVAPNSSYLKTTLSGYEPSEDLMLAGKSYIKQQGHWLETQSVGYSSLPGDISLSTWGVGSQWDVVNYFKSELAAARYFQAKGGPETINGVQTQPYTFELVPYSTTGNGSISPY